MVLYTPLVEHDIFPYEEEEKRKFISYEGKMLHVTEVETGHYKIEQLISTNPAHYLDEDFTPGTIIRY